MQTAANARSAPSLQNSENGPELPFRRSAAIVLVEAYFIELAIVILAPELNHNLRYGLYFDGGVCIQSIGGFAFQFSPGQSDAALLEEYHSRGSAWRAKA